MGLWILALLATVPQLAAHAGPGSDRASLLTRTLQSLWPQNLVATPQQPTTTCPHDCSRRGLCVRGECKCSPHWGGRDCSEAVDWCPENCRGHGVCNPTTLTCECERGFVGVMCETVVPVCPNNCMGHGRCNPTTGRCECSAGFSGNDCSHVETAACEAQCSSHGMCVHGKCICEIGFGGEGCNSVVLSDSICPNACSAHGSCVRGECVCEPGFIGEDCSFAAPTCPNQCSGRGRCEGDVCHCALGWFGDDCHQNFFACPNFCSGHGACAPDFSCRCAPGYSGDACEVLGGELCPDNCNGLGVCHSVVNPLFFTLESHCQCFPDAHVTGAACAHSAFNFSCPHNCSGNGFCDSGKCACSPGFHGVACERLSFDCPRNCSGHGVCRNRTCVCTTGYRGEDCRIMEPACVNNCSHHGVCYYGTCRCDPEWGGEACNATCHHNCTRNGKCNHGVCDCQPGWKGFTCRELDLCTNDCNGRGVCVDGVCECEVGWGGEDCSSEEVDGNTADPTCDAMNRCSGHGSCVWDADARKEQCECVTGWLDLDCSRELYGVNSPPDPHDECIGGTAVVCVTDYIAQGCPPNFPLPPQCASYVSCLDIARQQRRCPSWQPTTSNETTVGPIQNLSPEMCAQGPANECVQSWLATGCPVKLAPECVAYELCHNYVQDFCPGSQRKPEAPIDCQGEAGAVCLQLWVNQGCPLVNYQPVEECVSYQGCLCEAWKVADSCPVALRSRVFV